MFRDGRQVTIFAVTGGLVRRGNGRDGFDEAWVAELMVTIINSGWTRAGYSAFREMLIGNGLEAQKPKVDFEAFIAISPLPATFP